MASGGSDRPWPLSAPESFVLLNGAKADGAEAFKLGVLELVTRRALALRNVEERGMLGRRKQVAVLTLGPDPGAGAGRPLRSIAALHGEQRQQAFGDGTTGVKVEDLARAASTRYAPLGTYVEREVLPALVERGLFRVEERRTLRLFTSTRHVLTSEGEAARQELVGRMGDARAELAAWADRDPRRAMAYAGLAGAALLLMPDLYPDLQRLAERLRVGADGGDDGGADADEPEDERDDGAAAATTAAVAAGDAQAPGRDPDSRLDLASTDAGGLDLGGLAGLDFGAFDGIGDAFAAIDAGVDSGGDGGGDGGGGDGGGGGGD